MSTARIDHYDVGSGVTTITEWNLDSDTYTVTVDGTVTDQRPLTEAERSHYTNAVEAQAAVANVEQMTTEQDESVDKLVLVVENLNAITAMTNADINSNPAAIIKDVARELKTVARVANREARITSGRTESTDTGSEVVEP